MPSGSALRRVPDRRTRLSCSSEPTALICVNLFGPGSFKSLGRVGGQVMMSKNGNLVLVVDDDLGMLTAIKRLLRAHDYEPILFSSAQAFKNHPGIEKAACIILDINLPDGSGIELREDLKAGGVSVPVIFITGNESPVVRKAALNSGCVAFLTKPFSSHELIEPLKGASAETT